MTWGGTGDKEKQHEKMGMRTRTRGEGEREGKNEEAGEGFELICASRSLPAFFNPSPCVRLGWQRGYEGLPARQGSRGLAGEECTFERSVSSSSVMMYTSS